MRLLRCIVLSIFTVILGWAYYPHLSVAGIDLPWSTSFDCADWVQNGSFPNCNNISVINEKYYCNPAGPPSLTSPGPYPSKIEAAGNNPSGGGGKGFRKMVGDGKNNSGSSPRIFFNTPQSEFWVRLYKREPFGYRLGGLQAYKLFYISQTGQASSGIVYILASGPNGRGGGMGFYKQYGGGTGWYYPDHAGSVDDHTGGIYNWGWQDIWGGPTGDGKWHSFELHVKTNSGPGVADGIVQVWVDGILRNDHHNINWDNDLFTSFTQSNDDSPQNGACTYVDFDDFAVTNVTPSARDAQGNPMIGPVSGVISKAPPSPPTLH